MLPTYIVSQEARRHVTVALNGDGGDEAFAGYDRVQRLLHWAGRRRPSLGILRHLPMRLDPMHPLTRARRLALRVAGPLEEAYFAWVQVFPEKMVRACYTKEMKERCRRASADRMLIDAFRRGGSDPLWRVQQAEYSTYLPGDLLPKVDIASMAVSLEARSPLLDHRFVELAAS